MATENANYGVVLTYSESYYEERASVEEIYLEVIVEVLRSRLISESPQDNCPTPSPETAFQSYREVLANLFQE